MAILKYLLQDLVPIQDYHFLSLYPQAMFAPVDFVPSQIFKASRCIDIGETQAIGLGFVKSKSGLFRELNHGID